MNDYETRTACEIFISVISNKLEGIGGLPFGAALKAAQGITKALGRDYFYGGTKVVRKGSTHLSTPLVTVLMVMPFAAMSARNLSYDAWTTGVVMLPELSTKRPITGELEEVNVSKPQIDAQSERLLTAPLSRLTTDAMVRSLPSGLFTVSNSKPVGLGYI